MLHGKDTLTVSRGLGRLQRLILENLDHKEQTQTNELFWRLALIEKRIIPGRELDKAFYSSARRAVILLKGHVKKHRRKLVTLDELVSFYQFRTRSVEIKKLRERLLPILKSYIEQRNASKFSGGQSEKHLLDRLSQETQEDTRRTWHQLESSLFDLLCCAQKGRRDALFSLIARGRQLFVPSEGISHSASLGSLIAKAFDSMSLGEGERSLQSELHSLYSECFPRSTMAHTRLKSQLYSIADFRKYGPPHLKEEFKEFLLQEDRPFIEGLRGHTPAHEEKIHSLYFPRKVRFSPVLDKLILRDALAPFDFLALAHST